MNDGVPICLIADDFTGAMDAGVMFARAGLPTRFCVRKRATNDCSEELTSLTALVLSTNSREVAAGLAAISAQSAAGQVSGRRLFKKIDSTMRGNVGIEINAILDQSRISKAVICPAAIEVGRTVRGGQLYVHGEPLHQTAYANDPHWPTVTSEMAQLLRAETSQIHLPIVRQGVDALMQAVNHAEHRLVTIDAENRSDLSVIAEVAAAAQFLPCGSMGLAGTWVEKISKRKLSQSKQVLSPTGNLLAPVLIISGSRHPQNSQQIAHLTRKFDSVILDIGPDDELLAVYKRLTVAMQRHRVIVMRLPEEQLSRQAIIAAKALIGDLVCAAYQAQLFKNLVLIGGEIAASICQSLDIEGIQILGEIEPGIPMGRMISGGADSQPIITKAGGFGDDQTLTAVVKWLIE